MSNRKRPSRPELTEYALVDGSVVDALRHGVEYQCPDCNSEVVPIAIFGANLARCEVRHDEGCPWLAGMTRR